jgi:hypothetical protein
MKRCWQTLQSRGCNVYSVETLRITRSGGVPSVQASAIDISLLRSEERFFAGSKACLEVND